MRMAIVGRAGALVTLATLAGCGKPVSDGAAAAVPTRRAGLWEQVLTRDGKPGRLGVLDICLDAAADQKLSAFGRHFGEGKCERTVTRDAAGVYHFASSCNLENGAVAKTMGTATGDFGAGYSVHSEVNVSGAPFGPMNGMHVVDISGRYKGPCPSGMRPGDVSLGSGLKVNMDRLPKIAEAMGGG